ncbi:MAG: histidine kinase [Bifidobacteriaceae bacterium]|nr:histidine kinase [Bifidobacteriaceae bacterium]
MAEQVGGQAAADPALPQPGPLRRFAARHPRGMDFAAAGFYLVLSGSSNSLAVEPGAGPLTIMAAPDARPEPALAGSPSWMLVAFFVGSWLAGGAMLLAWRRPKPLWLLAGALVADAAGVVAAGRSEGWLLLFALFAVSQRAPARWAWLGLGATCAELVILNMVYLGRQNDWALIVPEVAMYVLAVSIFVHFGNRRRYVAALVASAHHLALERDQRAQIAVAAERARIAREMHDVIAHSVAVMVTLADGAQAAIDRDPDRAKEALALVSKTGRHTVADMRRLLSVLRTEPELVPQPGAADLVPLVESFTRSGLPVSLELAAAIPEDQALALAVYRIAQESLTNVLRHGGGPDWVRVKVDEPEPATYRVAVENGPPRSPAAGSASKWEGSGQGLVGMAQRVAVFGGELEAGPTPGGGWRVVATLKEER